MCTYPISYGLWFLATTNVATYMAMANATYDIVKLPNSITQFLEFHAAIILILCVHAVTNWLLM